MRVKDRIYNFLVRRNDNVRYEYERYVQEHIQEHSTGRMRHWKVLWRLILHYRIKKKTVPLLYVGGKSNEKASAGSGVKGKAASDKTALPYLKGAESRYGKYTSQADLIRMLMQYDVVSFDLFDTVLFRPFSKTDEIFRLVGNELNVLNFYTIRREAESDIRNRRQQETGSREVSIEDIYSEIEKRTGISAEKGINTEIAIEKQFLYLNPYMEYVIRTLKSNGKRIVFLSDMYLHEAQIREMLRELGLDAAEKVFVSCDYGESKRGGGLYHCLLRYVGDSAESIIHVGDNVEADIEQAAGCGIDSYYYPNVNKIYGQFRTSEIPGIIGNAYRGVVNAYLHNGSSRYDVYYELGFIYGGFFAMGYANHIHKYAREHGVEKVLFVARDGYVLKQIYDSLYPEEGSDYILSSRILNTKLTAYKNKQEFYKEFVYRFLKEKITISVGEAIENMELESLIPKLSSVLNMDEALDGVAAERLIDALNHCWDDVLEIYMRKTAAIRKYYENYFGNCRKALVVDIGWRGQGALALSSLEEDVWHFGCEIVGMLAASAPTSCNIEQLTSGRINAYMFSPIKNRDCFEFHSKIAINNVLTELLAGAPCPSFRSIVDTGESYEFVFEPPEIENIEVVNKIHQGEMDFVKEYRRHFKGFPEFFDISGHDAYMPIKHLFKDYSLLRKYMKGYLFQDCVGGTSGSTRTMRDIFVKFGL